MHLRRHGESYSRHDVAENQRWPSTKLESRMGDEPPANYPLDDPTYSINGQDTQRLGDQGNDRVDSLEEESLLVAETDGLENISRIVLDDGDTGHLNGELKNDAQEDPSQVGGDSEDLSCASDQDLSRQLCTFVLTSTQPDRICASADTLASSSAYSACTKTSEVSPRACSRARLKRASSFRPLIMSHRGDCAQRIIRA